MVIITQLFTKKVSRIYFESQLNTLKQYKTFRHLNNVEYVSKKHITINAKTYINFTSNDYLGLAQLPININQLNDYLSYYGINYASSRLVSGNSQLYQNIERLFCSHYPFEDALITNSGYDANLAIFNIFKDQGVIVFSDARNHASIIDGIKLSGLSKRIYPHLDYNALDQQLSLHPTTTKLIVTDSIFSTHGTMADLQQIITLKKRHPNTYIVVDHAHGLGLNLYDTLEGIDILTASLSKALGTQGGIILCSNTVKQLLVNLARPLIYSSALPIFNLYQIERNLHYLCAQSYRATKLVHLSQYFNLLAKDKMNTQNCHTLSPIKYIEFDSYKDAETIYEQLLTEGILVSYFRYPTVDRPMLRISLSYFHNEDDIKLLLQLCHNLTKGD
ncbi:aminotransferase class I/II-fold pyridoxal phosphate-dependent enzyme [Staphylococcus gallinarum]|uniref:aminotransferase class I/II-fold pyridoxal phosphate-dependent enzyme n=1 Tax=Staphylococcus gallinarum TaxID=1293 RepID=UPI001E345F73|nr:aminotransferase class I/II-fold pyridoxal phosphate-dependent enzyme [Staphylococcus gallinarum]MCW0986276.1 aminotransferase class I/II-fold pyridoxal phosphate-dependent enzyme [Staphylococcus gallinarum]